MSNSGKVLNRTIGVAYVCSFVVLALLLLLFKLLLRFTRNSLHRQDAPSKSPSLLLWFKRHLIYAPLFRQRRAKDIVMLRGKINFGCLPDRVQSIVVVLTLGMNVFLAVWKQPYSSSTVEILTSFNYRLGVLAVANFIPIVITSSVSNPLVQLLDISYNSFNLLHRWLARITVLEIIAHALCHVGAEGLSSGWAAAGRQLQSVDFFTYGLVAACLFTAIAIMALKPIRTQAYELFHYLHILMLIPAFTLVWLHLPELPQKWYLLTAIALWACLRLSRSINLLYHSLGWQSCTATIEKLPCDAVKVAVQLPRPWRVQPGQSLYLSILGINSFAMHPFSVAWSDIDCDKPSATRMYANDKTDSQVSRLSGETVTVTSPRTAEPDTNPRQRLYCIIQKQAGMTKKLHNRAQGFKEEKHTGSTVSIFKALVAGPYGKPKDMTAYQNVLLVAGGVGITRQLLYIRQLLHAQLESKQAPAHVRLLWIARSEDVLEWIRPWLGEIEDLQRSTSDKGMLRMDLYVTRSTRVELPQKCGLVHIVSHRPSVPDEIKLFMENMSPGRSCISVCAGDSLSDCVRDGVRKVLKSGVDVDYDEETFGW